MPGTKPTSSAINAAVATAAAGVHRSDLLNGYLNDLLAWLGVMAGKDSVAPGDLAAGTGGTLLGYRVSDGAASALPLGAGLSMAGDGTLSAIFMTSGAVQVGPGTYNAALYERVRVDPTARSFTIQLPAGSANAQVEVVDVSATGASTTNPVTILPGTGDTVLGATAASGGVALDDGGRLVLYYDAVAHDWGDDDP